VAEPSQRSPRLAELVAVLSLGTDLGLGQPMEHVLRQCLIALRLAERLGVGEEARSDVYYGALLAWVGCHVDAHEQARWFGDDLAVKRDIRLVDLDGVRADLAFMLSHLGTGRPPLERLRLGLTFLGEGRRSAEAMLGNHCLATDDLAVSLGLGDGVRESLRQSFERWDGHGLLGLRGEETVLPARLIAFADVVEVYQRSGGADAAVAVARERRGTQFDPTLVELLAEEAGSVLGDLDSTSSWDAVIAAEPALARSISDEELGGVLEAVADFVDLKSPYTLGHSRTVADLAGAAAGASGLPAAEATLARRAGLVHDLGRLGVSNAIWDKRGELTRTDWERIRLHPYFTERMLASSHALAPLAAVAAHHHERVDGSGYPRALVGEALTPSARILAAADVYTALTEDRPHRPACSAEEAASIVRGEVRAGRLDGDASDAVLAAAGHRVPRRREGPAGLTAREIEVLRLVARGLSTKEIAERLVISRKTARNHVEHIYAKARISNRAQASLFAVKHGLLPDAEVAAAPGS
jgi:HD-GYP domain-containing protein (c-di-GMP phosphodiesterase class II)